MGSTVLEIGNVAAAEAGLPQQTSLVGNSDQNAVRILRAVIEGASRSYKGQDWVSIQSQHNFTTDASAAYDLPTDFDRFINLTIWDRTNDRQVVGPVGPVEWQRLQARLAGLTGLEKFGRIVGNADGVKELWLYPDTDTGSDIYFEYISTKYIVDESGTDRKAAITKDGDTFLFDDDVVESATTWRLLRMLGLNYSDERIEFEDLLEERAANDGGAGEVNMQLGSRHWRGGPNIPKTGFGS